MRPCSGALALLLASPGGATLWSADLFTVTLADGTTVFYWTSFDRDLEANGQTYSSRKPWLQRTKWNVKNSMEVPTMTVILRALNDSFAGGASIKAQIHNGLFDGASFTLDRAFMVNPGDTVALGTIMLFSGVVAGIDLDGITAEIEVKGLNNKLNANAPRNIYQAGCIHTFCDPGCTLLRAAFTTNQAVGASPTKTFIPWAVAPGTEDRYIGGTVRFTSGPDSSQSRTVEFADAIGLTLSYPLYALPIAGDTFTAFEGCNKTKVRCTFLSNIQNFRAFPTVPPAETAY